MSKVDKMFRITGQQKNDLDKLVQNAIRFGVSLGRDGFIVSTVDGPYEKPGDSGDAVYVVHGDYGDSQ